HGVALGVLSRHLERWGDRRSRDDVRRLDGEGELRERADRDGERRARTGPEPGGRGRQRVAGARLVDAQPAEGGHAARRSDRRRSRSVPPPGFAPSATVTLPLNAVATFPCASSAVTCTAGAI